MENLEQKISTIFSRTVKVERIQLPEYKSIRDYIPKWFAVAGNKVPLVFFLKRYGIGYFLLKVPIMSLT